MNRWNPLNRLVELLNAALDEFLQFACLACQAVPWLHGAMSRKSSR